MKCLTNAQRLAELSPGPMMIGQRCDVLLHPKPCHRAPATMRAKSSALVMPVEFGNEPVGSMGPLRATFASGLGSNVFLQILPIAGSQ
jgi:hypothetical protein